MARTRARSAKLQQPPSVRWIKLQHHDQVICWNYFQYTATKGEVGWNPENAGSVNHYKALNWIVKLGSQSWFRHRAKLMVTLAKDFADRNESPPNPTVSLPQPDLPISNSNVATAAMKTPPPTHVTATPSSALSVADLTSAFSQVGVNEKVTPSNAPGIPAPAQYGNHESFDYKTRKSTEFVLARALLHGAVTMEDLVFEWVSPRLLKFRVAWPEFFLYAEQMAELCMDGCDDIIFPANHPLTFNTAKRNMEMVDSDGKKWDDGYLTFEQDMLTSNPIIELVDVEVSATNKHVNVLQVYAQ